jgi:hypothetical protein
LFTALEEESWKVTLRSSYELCETIMDGSSDAILAVVDPVGCAAASRDRSEFFAKLTAASRRIAISAEAVEDTRYEQQLRLPVDFDAVFDVGFVSQRDKHPNSNIPYYFVFNGPTRQEEQIIAELPPSQERYIPWTLVGYQTPEHLDLVAALMDYGPYPGGFVFLPRFRRTKQRDVPLNPTELMAVLSRTKYYVWSAPRSSKYYDSARFIQALLAGAVPCEIGSGHSRENSNIPVLFSSVRSFCERVREEDYWSIYRMVRECYISKGSLAEHLGRALRLV